MENGVRRDRILTPLSRKRWRGDAEKRRGQQGPGGGMTAACGVQQQLRKHVADNVGGGEVAAGIAILVDGGHEDSIRRHAHQKNRIADPAYPR